MSPRATFLLTLAGVILVGIPLPFLTRSEKTQPPPAATTVVGNEPVWAVISFTGKPQSIKFRPIGQDWQEADLTASGTEIELELPARKTLEIEVQANWEGTEVQALSLSLEPAGREGKTETQWKEAGSHTLHSIFSFRW